MKISEILKNIDDIDEPACMDKILMYLEEIKEETEQFMQLLINKLEGKEIKWELPWYQQTNSVTRPLIENNNEIHVETYKTDTICKAENDLILKNWHAFMEEYDVPDKLICFARWRNKDKSRKPSTPEEHARRYLIAYLGQGLQRTPFQIFRHIQTYFGGPVKGPYSPEEEKIMEVCFRHHPNSAVILLSMVLAREPRGIYKRLNQLCYGKPEKKKIKWTLPLATKFLKLLMKYTGLPLEELKNKSIHKDIWIKLAKDFDQQYFCLQKFWYYRLHNQIFVKERVKINKLRKKVFEGLRLTSYQIWSDIRWKDVVHLYLDGVTHHFLYKISHDVVRTKKKYHKLPLSDLINYALMKIKRCRKRRLKTLRFNKNEELEEVVYNKSDVMDES